MTSDPSLPHYPDTVLLVELSDGDAWIDLREPVPDEIAERLVLAGLRTSAVITASNPHGHVAPDAENDAADGALRTVLEHMGRPLIRATGMSPDRSHREPGFMATMTDAAAGDVSRQFGQSAFFWFDGAAFWLVGAGVDIGRQRLPRSSV